MDKFPEMTGKQQEKFKNYLTVNFDKPYHQIKDCMEFFEGRVNEIGFGMFTFTRTRSNMMEVKSTFKSQYSSGNITASELTDKINL